jgi:hypothetical protein
LSIYVFLPNKIYRDRVSVADPKIQSDKVPWLEYIGGLLFACATWSMSGSGLHSV